MTTQETSILVGALVGLFGAVQAWLVGKSLHHGNQLNGLMAPAIASGAAAVVVAHHLAEQALPAAMTAEAKTAYITALQAELKTLDA